MVEANSILIKERSIFFLSILRWDKSVCRSATETGVASVEILSMFDWKNLSSLCADLMMWFRGSFHILASWMLSFQSIVVVVVMVVHTEWYYFTVITEKGGNGEQKNGPRWKKQSTSKSGGTVKGCCDTDAEAIIVMLLVYTIWETSLAIELLQLQKWGGC